MQQYTIEEMAKVWGVDINSGKLGAKQVGSKLAGAML